MSDSAIEADGFEQRRFRSLIGLYLTMFGIGLAYGLVLPAMSIKLEAAGHAPSLIGAVAAMSSLSVLLAAPFAPRLHARFGMIPIITVSLMAEGVVYLLLTQVGHIAGWFVLSFLFGLFNTVPWVMGEVWLNSVVPEAKRGRYMGFYAGVWGLGMAIGPQLLIAVGSDGNGAFLLAALVYFGNALSTFILRRGAPVVKPDPQPKGSFRMAALMPVLVIYAIAGGLAEVVVYAMMPVYAIDSGYGEAFGASLITAFAAGGIILQYVVGWLSDRFEPRYVMTGLLAAGAASALLLPLAGGHFWLAMLAGVLFGGTAMSVYTLAITLVGHGIAQQHLPAVHALMVTCYTVGGLSGPWLAGLVMQVASPSAMHWFVALIFALCFLLALAPAGRRLVSEQLMELGE
jgi:MFS family permease